METILLLVHLFVAMALVGLILVQKSEGGAMGGGLTGGASVTGMSQSRVRATPITRATTLLGICFFATSLGLALLAKPAAQPGSIFETAPQADGPGQIPIVPVVPGNGTVPVVPSVPVDQ